ncbi:MAG TPA: hypothetical protein VKZ81_08800 [Pseudonocardia sp.]|nr:hypothetical protein [Pseudonocardia sp.]HLU55549.1 hypothetical protein [Pseudonocardia sp.]
MAELAGYSSHADLLDLAAVLDRYADEDTAEIREIVAGRAALVPGHGRAG